MNCDHNDQSEENEVITCADCGCELDAASIAHSKRDGDPVCDDCEGEYVDCADCGETIRQDEAGENVDGDLICEDCRGNYFTCEDCGHIVHSDNIINVHDNIICDRCLEDNYCRCTDCGEYFLYRDVIELHNGGCVCLNCYGDGNYFTCDGCCYVFHTDDYNSAGDNGYCDSCYAEYANRAIHEYSYKPEWEYRTTDHEERTSRAHELFYLGIELEVENKANRRKNDDVADFVSGAVPAICKYDGSINDGFEIVFHPQTFTYATTEGKPAIDRMLDELRRVGFAGHNYGGMHVHISRSAFSRLHLYKFHRLFRQCENLFTFISQRKADKLNEWASFDCMGEKPGDSYNRYSALNYTYETVEVRIFNSTIRTDRFFKNLEAVKAALDFSKQYGIRNMRPEDFLRFIMNNRPQYKNLAAFLVERMPDTLIAAKVDTQSFKQAQKSLSRHIG